MTSVIAGTRTRDGEPAAAASIFRATSAADEAPLIAFLARAFSMDSSAPFLDPALVRWKYWHPRGDFDAPRSCVIERAGRIASHVGLWPARLDTSRGRLTGIQMIDWASDPAAPGAGSALVQRLLQQYDFIYSIGGSEMTRRVLPAFGFRTIAEVWVGARPLHPFAARGHEHRGAGRALARLGRNAWWSSWPMSTAAAGWTAAPAALDEGDEQPRAGQNAAAIPRSNAFFRYLQQCPSAAVRVYDLSVGGSRQGRVALSTAHGQVRIAGVWLEQPSVANLTAAYALAQRLARSAPSAPEITAMGSTAASEAAAVAAGFRVRGRRPVFLLQKKGLTADLPSEFQIADDDACFRYESALT